MTTAGDKEPMIKIKMKDNSMQWFAHYGVSAKDGAPGRGSGRYELGSGENPRSPNNFERGNALPRLRGFAINREAFENTIKKLDTDIYSGGEFPPLRNRPINRTAIGDRSGLTDPSDINVCINIAKRLIENAEKNEEEITNDVWMSSGEFDMYKLNERIKSITSLAGKIGKDAIDKNLTFNEAAKAMTDVLRYTCIGNADEKFTASVMNCLMQLGMKGYNLVTTKNFYDRYNKGEAHHKALQFILNSPEGQAFELQIHSPESLAAKYLKEPLYERARQANCSDEERKFIIKSMDMLADMVPDPPGIEKFTKYFALTDATNTLMNNQRTAANKRVTPPDGQYIHPNLIGKGAKKKKR